MTNYNPYKNLIVKQNLFDEVMFKLQTLNGRQNCLYSVILDMISFIARKIELWDIAEYLYTRHQEIIDNNFKKFADLADRAIQNFK